MTLRKTLTLIATLILLTVGLSACSSAADTANDNLTKSAENFEVPRRIIGVNLITDKVLWTVEGYCSYETEGDTVDVICAIEDKDRKNHVSRTTMGKADQATFISTQLDSVAVDFFRPRVIFRPEGIIPNFDLSTNTDPTDTSGSN